ncbi:MAG: shikimate dehydrogenase [Methylococcales bacterium]|nr:shikimate dehydrogenase [Methylococcales bacterium]
MSITVELPVTNDQYAVFGDPISHSKSPRIHQLFAQQTAQALHYQAKQVSAEQFNEAVEDFFSQGGKGLNCTAPLKELAWQRADALTDAARLAKAVNTLKRLADGRLQGDNTDGAGLIKDLMLNHALPLHAASILLLGAGGASRGIIGPLLAQSPKRLVIANRTLDKATALAAEFNQPLLVASGFEALQGQQFDLILNATSASLTGELPALPAGILAAEGSCYDLAYANTATPFVSWGRSQNAAKSLDGLGMLVEQAAAAFYLWRGIYPDTASVITLLNAERNAY